MSTIVLFEVEARAGKAEELIALFEEVLPDTRAFDGCEGVTVHRDQDAPDKLLLIERWASRSHYETYLAWRAERADPRPAALCVAPPALRFLDDVAA
jgi:quinol monooxygenase YgiN